MFFIPEDKIKEIYAKSRRRYLGVSTCPHAEHMREKFPVGTKVELIEMDDIQAPPPGTKGIVRYVDNVGDIGVAWENGSSLNLIPGEDRFRVIE